MTAEEIAAGMTERQKACFAWACSFLPNCAPSGEGEGVEQFCDDAKPFDTINQCFQLGILDEVGSGDFDDFRIVVTALGYQVRSILEGPAMQTEPEPEQRAVELLEAVISHLNDFEVATLTIQRAFEDQTRKLRDAVKAYHRLLGPIAMTLAERELIGEPLVDETVLFSFSGSGASDWTTIADFRKADELARQALKETPDAG